MICPLINKECERENCAFWFQEISENGNPVVNQFGCSMQMIPQYLMELNTHVRGMRISVNDNQLKSIEKISIIQDYTRKTLSNFLDFYKYFERKFKKL